MALNATKQPAQELLAGHPCTAAHASCFFVRTRGMIEYPDVKRGLAAARRRAHRSDIR